MAWLHLELWSNNRIGIEVSGPFSMRPLSLQRGNLIGVVHGNDAHVLVALVFLQAHVLRAVHVADAIYLEELVRVIDQVLVDDRFRGLGALLGEPLVDAHASGCRGAADHD